jgi:hypothetical protein
MIGENVRQRVGLDLMITVRDRGMSRQQFLPFGCGSCVQQTAMTVQRSGGEFTKRGGLTWSVGHNGLNFIAIGTVPLQLFKIRRPCLNAQSFPPVRFL